MKHFLFLLLVSITFSACEPSGEAASEEVKVEIKTEFGNMIVMLYNSTPKHRDNFIKLAKEGFYDDLLFHRVINGFMVQGGDPDSKDAAPGARLGAGGLGYLIDHEIGAPHIKGTLAAARTNNPKKQSSSCQFYLVQGQTVTDEALDQIEQQKNIKYNDVQRKLYKEVGGTPFLDADYTVFGEIVEGMDVLDKIATQQIDEGNRPIEDIKMKVRILE